MSFGLSLVNSVGYILPFFTRKNMLHSVKHFFITLRWRLVLLNIDSFLLFSTISIVTDSELGCAQINNYHICSWDEFLRSRMPLFFIVFPVPMWILLFIPILLLPSEAPLMPFSAYSNSIGTFFLSYFTCFTAWWQSNLHLSFGNVFTKCDMRLEYKDFKCVICGLDATTRNTVKVVEMI